MAEEVTSSDEVINEIKYPEPPYLFEKSQWTDLAIVVEGNKLFFNKYPLAMTSPVFQQMLSESADPTCLVLNDAKYEDMILFLQCLHPVIRQEITDKNLEAVTTCALKYKHEGILDMCKKYLIDNITLAKTVYLNFFFHVHFAEKYGLRDVVQAAVSSNVLKGSRFSADGGYQYNRYFNELTDRTKLQILSARLCHIRK